MRIYKSSYRDRAGKKQTTSKWYIEFRDPRHVTRKVCRFPAFTDHAASIDLGRRILQLAEFSALGETPSIPLQTWLRTLQPRMRRLLLKFGLLDLERLETGLPCPIRKIIPDATTLKPLTVAGNAPERYSPPREIITYFIQSEEGGPVKIGKTKNLRERFRAIQCGHHTSLRIAGFLPGDHEAHLHDRFNREGVRGEWFSPSHDLKDYLSHFGITIRG